MQCPSIPYKIFENIVGKLHHADIGLQAGKGLCKPFKISISEKTKQVSLGKYSTLFEAFRYWKCISTEIQSSTTSVYNITKWRLAYVGYMDASVSVSGRLWMIAMGAYTNIVWRLQCPEKTTKDVVSNYNPKGKLPTQIWKWRQSCYSG